MDTIPGDFAAIFSNQDKRLQSGNCFFFKIGATFNGKNIYFQREQILYVKPLLQGVNISLSELYPLEASGWLNG